MSADRTKEALDLSEHNQPPNMMAWAGIAFGVIAAVLYGVLFYMLSRLPSSRSELEHIGTNAQALTRLLIAGASAGLLNIVSLILCLTGYVLPGKSRFVAIVGSAAAALMLLAVFSVVIVSVLQVP